MPRKKESRRADGRAEILRTINGKPRHFYGKTKREAEEKYKAALLRDAKKQESGALFEEVAADWWADYQTKIKEGTARAYKGSYNAALSRFSGYGMKEITPGMVNTWGLEFKAQGKAERTAQNARSVLSLIFKYWCVLDGETYNPVPLVDLPRGMKRTERQPPTPEQIAAVKQNPEGFGLCAWLFMYTGCRLGEVLALQWQDVDFDAGIIRVSKSVAWINNRPVVHEPKTKNAVRIVPLLGPLRDVLQGRRGKPAEYILGGEKPLTGTAYQRRWQYYCRDAGLAEGIEKTRMQNGKRIRYTFWKPMVTAHQFRHEFASVLYEAGVGEMEAQKILGHADIYTTRKIYTHIRDAQIGAAAEKLEKYFSIVNDSSGSEK